MKILITGGLGNLGSWITEHLAGIGHQVTTFSLSDRDLNIKSTFDKQYGDITNENDVKRIIDQHNWDAIVHLASINEGDIAGYSKKSLLVNTWGTRNILQRIIDKNNNKCHFIYFSTFHIYGVSNGLVSEDKTPINPKSDYGASHLFAEYYVRQIHSTAQISYTIFRLTNSYGCPKEKNSSKWYLILNDLARSAFEKKNIRLKSNGLPMRDFIWMDDVCKVVGSCLEKGPANDIFNLGSGKSKRMIDVAEIVKQAYYNSFSEQIAIEVNKDDKTNYSDDLLVSIEKLKKWIDFTPSEKMYDETLQMFRLFID